MTKEEKIEANKLLVKYLKRRWLILLLFMINVSVGIFISNFFILWMWFIILVADVVIFLQDEHIKEWEDYGDEVQKFFDAHDCYTKKIRIK